MYESDEQRTIIQPNERTTPIELERDINRMAANRQKGLLIIDEAQYISYFSGNIPRPSGMNILNSLRPFVDRGMFGIALLSNGENFKRVTSKNGSAQLSSRMSIEKLAKLQESDIDLIMQAYGVSGKQEREWCVKVGMGAGGLRNIIKVGS